MCGIFCCIEPSDSSPLCDKERLDDCLERRGPDGKHKLSVPVHGDKSSSQNLHIMHMQGYTLQLQGPLTLQPMADSLGNVLMWNGEIFAGDIKVNSDENDGMVLLERLSSCKSDDDIPLTVSKIKGPWSFIYWREESKSLFFGRDYLGRRSLLWSFTGEDRGRFRLSSVALRPTKNEEVWEEVPADGIYKLHITQDDFSLKNFILCHFPWQPSRSKPPMVTRSGDPVQPTDPPENFPEAGKKVTIGRALPVPIAPLNKEISDDCCISEEELNKAATQLIKVLEVAIRRRVTNVPMRKLQVAAQSSSEDEGALHNPATVAVLFSGGIDSMVLAALSDRFVPAGQPIDLLNVAFEQKKRPPKKGSTALNEERDHFLVPDRITGRSGLDELRTLNPDRVWNLVEINISVKELKAARQDRIGDLIYPLTSVLDDSIGCAMWFAARGRGALYDSDATRERSCYTSQAKVVLSGLGADEQLAGYARHRAHFTRAGWEGLLSQIEMELDRIPSRNMGRDDRIISDHGRESRFPFLDEDVVSFLNGLSIHLKADLSLPRGFGEKQLLRVAARQIGLTGSTRLPKRAIQFGSRIAKLESTTQKASDICDRLLLS